MKIKYFYIITNNMYCFLKKYKKVKYLNNNKKYNKKMYLYNITKYQYNIIDNNKIKRLRFNNTVMICFIPIKSEILNKDLLWWNDYDFMYFKKDALEEILDLLNKHPFMDRKQAIKLLYQPNNICYDSTNFV